MKETSFVLVLILLCGTEETRSNLYDKRGACLFHGICYFAVCEQLTWGHCASAQRMMPLLADYLEDML